MSANIHSKYWPIIILIPIVIFFVLVAANSPKPNLQITHNITSKPIQIIEEPTVLKPDRPTPENPKSEELKPKIEEGGRDLERGARANAQSQLRGQGYISEGTVIHEGSHLLNANLNQRIGGRGLTSPSNGFCAFYLWGQNKYLIVPTAGFQKIIIVTRIPRETVSTTNFNVYFSSMFASCDAMHVLEDFTAELNGFEIESPTLLKDMLIFSVALGAEMQQINHKALKQYQAGNKFLIEQACKKQIDLSAFRSSTSPRVVSLKTYLKNTYGEDWTKRHLRI